MSVHVEKRKAKSIPGNRYNLFVWTDGYDPVFIEKIRLFPLRFYHSMDKTWEIPISALSLVYKNFRNVVVRGDTSNLTDHAYQTLEDYERYLATVTNGTNYEFKTEPDKPQLEFFNNMLERDKVILGDPMGFGKTKEYLDTCEYRKTFGYTGVLFIVKSKHKDNMGKEIEKHTNSKYLIVDGTKEQRLQILRKYYSDRSYYYLIISYEMAGTHSPELLMTNKARPFSGVLVDEFNKIKNFNTRKTRKDGKASLTIQIVNLIEKIGPELLIMGSGTPITKYATDLYAPFRLLGIEKRSPSVFREHYCKLDYWGTIIGPKNEQELLSRLKTVMIRRPKELLHLKDKRVTYMPVRMTPEQSKLYTAVKEQIREELKGTKAYGASQLALLTRLRQVTTNPRLIDADVEGIKEALLAEFIEETVAGGEKAVIFSIYKQETQILKEKFSSLNPAYIDGSVNSSDSQKEVDKLQTDPETKLLIGSLHAIKESYTMTAATQGFFMDLSWTVTDNQQAEDRLHRRGQSKPVNILIPYCLGTVDERVLEILNRDAGLITEVVDGAGVKISSNTIDYLLS